jgi:hypothetical protein
MPRRELAYNMRWNNKRKAEWFAKRRPFICPAVTFDGNGFRHGFLPILGDIVVGDMVLNEGDAARAAVAFRDQCAAMTTGEQDVGQGSKKRISGDSIHGRSVAA